MYGTCACMGHVHVWDMCMHGHGACACMDMWMYGTCACMDMWMYGTCTCMDMSSLEMYVHIQNYFRGVGSNCEVQRQHGGGGRGG